MKPDEQMLAAFNTYVVLAEGLSSDLMQMVEGEAVSQSWRRNYIRVVAALIEGVTHCLREMATIGLRVETPAIPKREIEAIKTGLGLSASERIEMTMRAVHSMFQLGPMPDDPEQWRLARALIEKSEELARPRTLTDLAISDESWKRLQSGAKWLIDRHFEIVGAIYTKYVRNASRR